MPSRRWRRNARGRRDEHAGGAEATLQRVAPLERILQVGDGAGIRYTLDRLDFGAVALHREHEAAAHHRAVDAHRAGAADALLAADMAAGEAEVIAQEIDQGLARLDALAHGLAVHAQTDVTEALAPN